MFILPIQPSLKQKVVFLGSLTAETGLSMTHTIKAPLPSMAKTYNAHFGVVAKSAKGSSSEMGSAMIEATTSINENYILQLSSDAVTTLVRPYKLVQYLVRKL